MKAIKIDNQHGIGLILGRTTTTIIDCHGMRKGDDEIILYVSYVSDMTRISYRATALCCILARRRPKD